MIRALVATCLAVAVAACQAIDPDKGTFSCSTPADCASGSSCRPQFAGGGRCFRDGLCADTELCNGVDDTCDGRIDESFPEEATACATGRPGVCAAGRRACRQGSLTCDGTVMPGPETCNQLDDDCDGQTDEDFDLTRDARHCGACGRGCGAGTNCAASRCVESRCDDRLDNDSNGASDCDDDACFGLVCDEVAAPQRRCGRATPPLPPADGGSADGGSADGGSADGGSLVRGCFFPETTCDDGRDDDGDGQADCLDPDCDGRLCFSGQRCAMLACPGPG
jgi:hypothetical protein